MTTCGEMNTDFLIYPIFVSLDNPLNSLVARNTWFERDLDIQIHRGNLKVKKVLALSAVVVAMVSSSTMANTKANDLAGGVEFDSEFSLNNSRHAEKVFMDENGDTTTIPLRSRDFGIKLFMSYNGAGLSVKANNVQETETNFNYTYGWEHVWLTGEYERVTKKYANDVNKFGLTVGSNVNEIVDLSFRYRKDKDSQSYNGIEKSNIDRFDFSLGKQLGDNIYLNAKLINFTENNKRLNDLNNSGEFTGKKNWNNYEIKMTFTGIDNVIPYAEYENAYIQRADRRDDNMKVGVIFPF